MTLIVPVSGEDRMLAKILASNLTLKLFTNNYTPVDTSVVGDLTEASGNGYAAITLTGGAWSISGGVATYAAQTFEFDGAGTYYGYFVVDPSDNTLMWAERFVTPSPITTNNDGDQVRVNPRLTQE